MFSLHIDTAETWRGGQNQVLLTVDGLRSIGHRAALVAHPDGELRRRAAEGLELIPIASRSEMDLAAAWKLLRVIRRLSPDVVHAHDAHGVAMAGLALSLGAGAAKAAEPPLVVSRRVDFRLRGNVGTRWKYGRAAVIVAISRAVARVLEESGVDPARVRDACRGDRPVNVDSIGRSPRQASRL